METDIIPIIVLVSACVLLFLLLQVFLIVCGICSHICSRCKSSDKGIKRGGSHTYSRTATSWVGSWATSSGTSFSHGVRNSQLSNNSNGDSRISAGNQPGLIYVDANFESESDVGLTLV